MTPPPNPKDNYLHGSRLTNPNQQNPLKLLEDCITDFFLVQVLNYHPDQVLKEFKNLFLGRINSSSKTVNFALERLIQEQEKILIFGLVQRCCLILLKNWSGGRYYNHLHQLVASFKESQGNLYGSSILVRHLKRWILEFRETEYFQTLEDFIDLYEPQNHEWSEGYANYLITTVRQTSTYPRNSEQEDKELTRLICQKNQERFKLELAKISAYLYDSEKRVERTGTEIELDEDILKNLDIILEKQGNLDYRSLANIFLKQMEGISYQEFKASLLSYLLQSMNKDSYFAGLQQELMMELDDLYCHYNDHVFDRALLLRTCNRLVDSLTTKDRYQPSPLFSRLAIQGKTLTLTILLLKIILISRHSYLHLESCITHLLNYYKTNSHSDCRWLVRFLKTLRITLTFYLDKMYSYQL